MVTCTFRLLEGLEIVGRLTMATHDVALGLAARACGLEVVGT